MVIDIRDFGKMFVVTLFIIAFVAFVPLSVHAAVTYDFEADTIGSTPANVTVTAGTFDVQDQATLGKSMRAVTQVGVIAGVIFSDFEGSSDQSVVWKQAYSNNMGRGGFTLRAQESDTGVANSAGAKQGYLFQVYDSGAVYIWKVGPSIYTALWSGSLSKAEPRWFKALAIGNEQGFYYSNDGVSYTLLASTTDATYTSGKVQYTVGYGSSVNRDYIDNIVITSLDGDTTAPTDSTFTPQDNVVDVATSSNLTIEFSEPVIVGTGNITVHRVIGDLLVEEVDVTSDRVVGSGTESITIDLVSDLESGVQYYVSIDEGAFKDAADNNFAGVSDSTYWNFTTVAAPEDLPQVEIPENRIYKMFEQSVGASEETMWTSVSASSDGKRLAAVGAGYFGEEVGQAGVIYVSSNGGVDWQLSRSFEDVLFTSVVSSADGMTIMALGPSITISGDQLDFMVAKSTDGGATWSTQIVYQINIEDLEVYGDEMLAYLTLYLSRIVASSDLSKVYIAIFNRVLYSDNGGGDWKNILTLDHVDGPLVFPISISTSANGAKVLLALTPILGGGEYTAVILSEQYGEAWVPVMLNEDVNPFSVVISEDGARLFVVDTYARNIYISTNGGTSWATSTNPDGNMWSYVAPSATGEGIVASAIRDIDEDYEDDVYEFKTIVYSSRDNGGSWIQQAESGHFSVNGLFAAVFGQLTGNLSGAYDLSNLGLVAFTKLYTITQQEPSLPVVETPMPTRSSPRSQSRSSVSRSVVNTIPVVTTIVSTTSPLITRDLMMGMTGNDILLLQKMLNSNGHPVAVTGAGSSGNETTFFGDRTRRSLAEFQKAHGIVPAAGYFGPLTRAKMKSLNMMGMWW